MNPTTVLKELSTSVPGKYNIVLCMTMNTKQLICAHNHNQYKLQCFLRTKKYLRGSNFLNSLKKKYGLCNKIVVAIKGYSVTKRYALSYVCCMKK